MLKNAKRAAGMPSQSRDRAVECERIEPSLPVPARTTARRQVEVEWRNEGPVLSGPGSPVLLNDTAAAILALCDGTRSRAEVLVEFLAQAGKQGLGQDAAEFCEAALQRGWIVES